MKPRFYFFFIFFSILFLFYPGDSEYFKIFAYNRQLFLQPDNKIKLNINPIPYLKFSYYPAVTAEGVYVVDMPSFTPILERNIHEKFIPASTAKIISALVISNIYKLDDIVTVNRIVTEGQTMGLTVGEKITVENLLYGILVHSGNDASYAIADFYGFDKFVKLMNDKAENLMMKNTHFVDPAGLEELNQYTTPFDLALAARTLLNNKELKKIVATKEIEISDVDYKYFHKLANVNKLLGEIQGIGGLKTGFTENAKENLISFYKNKDHQFIIVILKSEDRFSDTRGVVTWINDNIEYYSIE